MKVLIAYVPVLHKGYEKFFEKHSDADLLLIFGERTIQSFDWLRKDLRSLSPSRALQAIRSWGLFKEVDLLEDLDHSFFQKSHSIVMPDEIECRSYAEKFLPGFDVVFDDVKLRYDKKKTESTDLPRAIEVSSGDVIRMMNLALSESVKSYDWFIRVGGVLARDGEVLLVGYNEHKPDPREALFSGDPRSNYGRGVNIELSLADHAEKVLIAEAARLQVGTLGTDIYVTTFPCPPCARLIARAGIKRCFFKDGYSMMLESDEVLLSAGVEVFHVNI